MAGLQDGVKLYEVKIQVGSILPMKRGEEYMVSDLRLDC